MAWASKMNNEKFKVVVILSDAELRRPAWEALIFISHHKLVNLIIILDRNYQVVMNKTEDFLKLEPLDKKLKSFNFEVKNKWKQYKSSYPSFENTKKKF